MTNSQLEVLKNKMVKEKDEVTQNKGRLKQLKETAKNTYKVDSIAGLKELKKKKEEDLDMQKTKKSKQIEKLEAILPQEVKDELYKD